MTAVEEFQETTSDLWQHASAVDSGEVWVDHNEKKWPIWHVVTDFYEDETPVLAAGTPDWPMGEEEAEFLAKTMRAAVGRRIPPHRSGGHPTLEEVRAEVTGAPV